MSTEQKSSMFEAMDEIATTVAAFTGVKAQFVDSGWDPANAELMTIELMRASNKKAAETR